MNSNWSHSSETLNLGQNQRFFLSRVTKQYQALCIISSLYVNSNWIYGPEMAMLGFDLCDLDL